MKNNKRKARPEVRIWSAGVILPIISIFIAGGSALMVYLINFDKSDARIASGVQKEVVMTAEDLEIKISQFLTMWNDGEMAGKIDSINIILSSRQRPDYRIKFTIASYTSDTDTIPFTLFTLNPYERADLPARFTAWFQDALLERTPVGVYDYLLVIKGRDGTLLYSEGWDTSLDSAFLRFLHQVRERKKGISYTFQLM